MSIDISGLDKVELLRQLWSGTKPAAIFTKMPGMVPIFNNFDAKEAVKHYIDYFAGKCIKADLSGDRANTAMYDRDAGAGAFVKIVNKLRDERGEAHASDIEIDMDGDCSSSSSSDDESQSHFKTCVASAYTKAPSYYICSDGSGNKFKAYGEEMLPGRPETVLCGNCPMLLMQHIPVYE